MIDAFLKLVDFTGHVVEGESSDDVFLNQIEINDFDLGSGERGSAGALGDAAEETGDVSDGLKRVQDALKKLSSGSDAKDHTQIAEKAYEEVTRVTAMVAKLRQNLTSAAKTTEHGSEKPPPPKPTAPTTKTTAAGGTKNRLKFSVSKILDSASPDLFQAYCRINAPAEPPAALDKNLGKFSEAIVTVRKMFRDRPEPYITCTFHEVELDDYSLKFSSEYSTLSEELSFTFIRYTVRYQTQDINGDLGSAAPEISGTVGGAETGNA